MLIGYRLLGNLRDGLHAFSFCFVLMMDTWSMLDTILPLGYIPSTSLVYFETCFH